MQNNWSGLILALLIGAAVAWGLSKGRKKFGGSKTSGKTLIGTVVVVAIVLILIYDASHTPHH